MIGFLFSFFKLLLSRFQSRTSLLCELALLKKEIEILKRKKGRKQPLWGAKRIQGELMKLGIELDAKTIRNILKNFRNRGRIRQSLSWKNFLQAQAHSLYAMDFFTVDTIFKKRFFVFFIIAHSTREIIQFAITENPVKEFVRQQLIQFEQNREGFAYMIHDNAGMFDLDFPAYNIKAVRTSIEAPDMNAIAERLVETVRREALDNYLIVSENQVQKILSEFIEYYNTKRPHQGIGQQMPKGYAPQTNGRIYREPVLSGLHNHYYRIAA